PRTAMPASSSARRRPSGDSNLPARLRSASSTRPSARRPSTPSRRPDPRLGEAAMSDPTTNEPTTKREPTISWEGRFFEDFQVGDVYRHPHGRTITETDNTWFTLLTNNSHDIHYNADYASKTEFGRPLVVSTLTLAIVTGLSV